jgi:hypothetical protein
LQLLLALSQSSLKTGCISGLALDYLQQAGSGLKVGAILGHGFKAGLQTLYFTGNRHILSQAKSSTLLFDSGFESGDFCIQTSEGSLDSLPGFGFLFVSQLLGLNTLNQRLYSPTRGIGR